MCHSCSLWTAQLLLFMNNSVYICIMCIAILAIFVFNLSSYPAPHFVASFPKKFTCDIIVI